MIMKRFLKYTITLLVVIVLIPMTANAQTIKRSKQKTEQPQKSSSSTPKNSSPKPEKSKMQSGNNTSKKNSATKRSSTTQEQGKSQNDVSYANVTFSCNVQNAQLFVDGHNLGKANGKYRLTASNHLIRVKSDGYQERIIFFDASCTHNMEIELLPE